ncbi:MAG: hypothetical protein ACXWM8_01200 [Candidatus Limnocylindrales bacterium]
MHELSASLSPRRRVASITTAVALACSLGMALAPAAAAALSSQPISSAGPKAAAPIPIVATVIKLEVPTGSVLGNDVTVGASLTTQGGQPIVGEHLSLLLDGNQVRSDKTDATGKVPLVIAAKDVNEARAYAVQVTFGGARGLAASTANATLTILAAGIQFRTVPAQPDLRFTLGTETALTGPDGVAALPVPKTGAYQLTVDLNPDISATATVKASFVRWLDNVYTANRAIDVVGPATFVMGIRVAYRATIQYVDLNSQPVDPTIISQARFSTGTGTDDIVLNSQTGGKDVWWTAAAAVRFSTSLTASPTTYRALSVTIHGAEVVNRGQQAWTPTQNGIWTIQLLLYSMTVQTRDALFGTPVGGQLKLTYPDGVAVQERVDSAGRITFANLPRGQYQLALSSVAYSPPTPVALSKVQDSTLRVITYLDVALVLGIILLVGTAAIARWVVVSRRIRRRAKSGSQATA